MQGYKIHFVIYYIKSIEFSLVVPQGSAGQGLEGLLQGHSRQVAELQTPLTHSLSIPPHGWDRGRGLFGSGSLWSVCL